MGRDYRAIMEKVFTERRRKNSRYSMRAFARDLGVSAGQLSLILNGKRGLSPARAQDISAALGLAERDRDLFCTLVEALHSRSAAARRVAEERLRTLLAGAVGDAGHSRSVLLMIPTEAIGTARETVDRFLDEFARAYEPVGESAEMHVLHLRLFRVEDSGVVSGNS